MVCYKRNEPSEAVAKGELVCAGACIALRGVVVENVLFSLYSV